jgi:hypothetical protein
LEQTINADAASRLTGYTSATNNYLVRLRWSITKSSRAAIVGAALQLTGIIKGADTHAELGVGQKQRDNSDLQKIVNMIKNCANPFDLDCPDLINIHTGKVASEPISNSPLNLCEQGKTRHDIFNMECVADASRFYCAIKRHLLVTFANQGAKNKRAQNTVVQELRCTRDMFGHIALIASKK